MKKIYHPVSFRLKIRLPRIKKDDVFKSAQESGIIFETKTLEKEAGFTQRAVMEGQVMELGERAFKAYDDGKAWCKVGDAVLICTAAGIIRDDELDGDYIIRIINDEDVQAVVEYIDG